MKPEYRSSLQQASINNAVIRVYSQSPIQQRSRDEVSDYIELFGAIWKADERIDIKKEKKRRQSDSVLPDETAITYI
jgi:hypothetical protein